jgi:hypothetical protein
MKESTSLDDLEKQQKPHATAPWHYKYYRFKSGLIGSRDTISLRKDFNKQAKDTEVQNQLTTKKSTLKSFMNENSF